MDSKIFFKKHFGILSGLAIVMLKVVFAFLGIDFTGYFYNISFLVFFSFYILFLRVSIISIETLSILNYVTIVILHSLLLLLIGFKLKKAFKKYQSNNLGLKISLWIALWFIQIFVACLLYAFSAIIRDLNIGITLSGAANNFLSFIIEFVIPTIVIVFIGYKFDNKTKIENDQQNLSENVKTD
jgi:hypothetical protein